MVFGEESMKRSSEDVSDERPSKKFIPGGDTPLLKLLVPNYAAGALIGKGGSYIAEMQEKYGGNVRLSSSNEYYPGTEERVVVLTGKTAEIIDLNEHVMQKVQGTRDSKDIDGRSSKVQIVLTNAAAGVLIGRGGATIKSMKEESGAKMTISHMESSAVSQERVLTVIGSEEVRCHCCRLVIEKIAEEQSNMANTKVKYFGGGKLSGMGGNGILGGMGGNSLGGMGGSGILGGLGGSGMLGGQESKHNANLKTSVEVKMEVPDQVVGAMLAGKEGSFLRVLIRQSGAKFKFSDKNEFAEGTTNRILTITGDMEQTYTAHNLVNEKVGQLNSMYGSNR